MLAKRFAVAFLLHQGKKPIEIVGAIHVSYSMIRGVSSWLDRATPQTIKLLESLDAHQSWVMVADKLEETLDKLHPRYGTDWVREGKEKWKRLKSRSARRTLHK